MPRLHVIAASTRPRSNGLPVARWVAGQAAGRSEFETTLVDLAEVALPLLDEPEPASSGRYRHQHTLDWSATVAAADAFVLVMPMYNGGFGAPLKNALDYLYAEWQDKPVGIVSYSGGASGGTPATEMIKPVLTRLTMKPASATVAIPYVDALVGPDGTFQAPAGLAERTTEVLDELAALLAVRCTNAV